MKIRCSQKAQQDANFLGALFLFWIPGLMKELHHKDGLQPPVELLNHL